MENLNDVLGLQAEFEKFKEEYKNDLLRFIWYKDDVDFVLDEKADTFYFSPKGKKIWIPMKWIKEYTTLLHNNDESLESHKMDGKFSLAHEFSHFRDMLKEQEITSESSMYKVLKKLSGKKIKIDDKKIIPIWKMIHTIYNCIDDIIVNYEVMNFEWFGIDKNIVKEIYQKNLFADYKELPDKSKKLNLDEPVNYSGLPDYTALSYYFLRKKMVPDQGIILSDDLKNILFNEKWQNIPWGTSLKRLKELFNKEVEEAKNSDNPVIKARYEQLKLALNNQKIKLDHINTLWITWLLGIALKSLKNYDVSRISTSWLTLERIIDLFTVNKWWDDSHILCISPDLRYKIYEAIFEPIIETLILIHALHNEIKDWNGWWKWEWEEWWEGWDWGEEWWQWGEQWWGWWDEEWEWEEWEDEGWEWWEPQSGNGSYNRSLEDALKFIEEAAEYNQGKKKEEQVKKEAEKVWKTIIEVLWDKWISPEDWKFKEKIQKNFSEYITQITKILYDELYALEIQRDTTNIISKKWSLNYNEFMKEFSKSFVDGDFSEKSIYDRKRNIEKIKEEFKKLCFYFMIDVSWSTEWFKWENWLLNGIPLSLALAIKNAERAIQNLSGDPSYSIPIKFIIYTDSVNYFTDDKDIDDMEAEIVRVSSKIARISGWTEDTHGWTMVWQELSKDFQNHPEYIEDIKGWKMKPVVVQIADTDVSEDGVTGLEKVIERNFGTEIKDALMPKRIILWQEQIREMGEDEFKELNWKGKWNWHPEYVRWPDGAIVTDKYWKKMIRVKEIWVRNKKEIVDGIKSLFKNFFADMIKEKI